MFDRINTGGMELSPMEARCGVRKNNLFMQMIDKLGEDSRLHSLEPLSKSSIKRRDYQELILRFFAYPEGYQTFTHSVIDFINNFLDSAEGLEETRKNSRTARVRFEAIAVGVALALRENPDLMSESMDTGRVLEKEFIELVTSDVANSKPGVKARIEYVRDKPLK